MKRVAMFLSLAVILAIWLVVSCGFAVDVVQPLKTPEVLRCRPTGWVDRIEAGLVVVDPDQGEEEKYYPLFCFPEFPREGTRVVHGYIDWQETHRVRRNIDRLVRKMVERGRADQ